MNEQTHKKNLSIAFRLFAKWHFRRARDDFFSYVEWNLFGSSLLGNDNVLGEFESCEFLREKEEDGHYFCLAIVKKDLSEPFVYGFDVEHKAFVLTTLRVSLAKFVEKLENSDMDVEDYFREQKKQLSQEREIQRQAMQNQGVQFNACELN